MAQPQGLNVPVIITTALVTVVLTGSIFEGVHAYYNYYESLEEAKKWDNVKVKTIDVIRADQEKNIKFQTSIPIGDAMAQVVAQGGKMPATQPAKSDAAKS